LLFDRIDIYWTEEVLASKLSHMKHKTTVSLVLGGGGARGLAHIGAIQWLSENGYTIKSIAGTSMGALVGGIYASGKLEAYTEWVSTLDKIDILRLLDPAFGRSGFFKGDRIFSLLRKLVGDTSIEKLPLAFTAVATDLETGKEVWLRQGKLFDAIRASIAIPLIFTPFKYDHRQLLDGSLVNPVPIAPTLNDTTDLTIAISLSGQDERRFDRPARTSDPKDALYSAQIETAMQIPQPSTLVEVAVPGMISIVLKSMDTMQSTIARLKLAAYSPDVLVEIPHNACQFHEFWRAKELIAFGRERTARTFSQMKS
jgi:NTE family protein